MIKTFIRIFLTCIMPLYLLIAFLLFSDRGEKEICKEVRICIQDSVKSPFLKLRDVQSALQRNRISPVGKQMSEINTNELRERLEENPIIRKANCYKTPDGTLKIDIYQRNPILRVIGANGNYYIDDEGMIMPVSYNFTAHLPVASGQVTKDLASSGLYQFALFLNNNRFWKYQIEQIYIQPNGDVELVPKVGDHIIQLGDFSDFEKKLDNLMTFYKKGLSKKGWNVYKTINLKYENQVICSK